MDIACPGRFVLQRKRVAQRRRLFFVLLLFVVLIESKRLIYIE